MQSLKIPYNALRFPELEIQNWSINFYRRIININETHSFAAIDNTKGRETQYNAPLLGIEKNKPSYSPYFFSVHPRSCFLPLRVETTTSFSAGMDLKYGS